MFTSLAAALAIAITGLILAVSIAAWIAPARRPEGGAIASGEQIFRAASVHCDPRHTSRDLSITGA